MGGENILNHKKEESEPLENIMSRFIEDFMRVCHEVANRVNMIYKSYLEEVRQVLEATGFQSDSYLVASRMLSEAADRILESLEKSQSSINNEDLKEVFLDEAKEKR